MPIENFSLTAVKIVQALRTDEALERQLQSARTEEDVQQVLEELKQRGVAASTEQLVEARTLDRLLKPPAAPVSAAPPVALTPEPQTAEFDLGLELKKSLVRVIRQIEDGYKRIMWMYLITFGLGVFLIVVSAVASLVWQANAAALILGGVGLLDVVVMMLRNPAQDLQLSRGNLAQLQAAFVYWVNDIYNWNRYLVEVSERAAAQQQAPDMQVVRDVSQTMLANTGQMMKLVEEYCGLQDADTTDRAATPAPGRDG
jgi:hypothetical protein